MRKWIMMGAAATASMMLLLTGCSGSKPAETTAGSAAESADASAADTTEESAAAEEAAADIDPAEMFGETESYAEKSAVVLADYHNIPVTMSPLTISDEEVQAQIDQVLAANPIYTEVDRPAQNGDTANIDYEGKKDGVAFDGGTSQGYDLVLGSGSFIPGFEEGVVGMKAGETKDIPLTFPENYHAEDLAGQEVVFTVTLNAVKEKKDAELNAELFESIGSEAKNEAEYRKEVREQLETTRRQQAEDQRDQDIMAWLVENSGVTIGKTEVDKQYNQLLISYTNQAKMYGMDLAGMAAAYGMDEKSFRYLLHLSAEDNVRNTLVLEEVAAKENITASQEDMDAFAAEYGYENSAKMIESAGISEETLQKEAVLQNVRKFLAENADITIESDEETPAEESESAAQ